METALRGPGDERGFTLIELLVVVLIIAILLGIAIPTYLGARTRAMDRGAQSTARNAFVAARISYAGTTTYTADPTEMASIEPNLAWTSTPLSTSSTTHAAYVDVSVDRQTIVLGARASNGHCFFIEDVMSSPNTATRYFADTAGGVSCSPPPMGDPTWAASW